MRFLRDLDWREPADGYLAAKLRAAGLVLLGKTNTPELGLLPTTEPEAFGRTRNPWNAERSAGGSSGGSAAAVAAGMVPAAHASDGGGSIRIPASACGVVGLKPSRGRISRGPHEGEALGGIATDGPISRSVRDTALLLDVMAGAMPGDPYTAPAPLRPFATEVGADPGRLHVGVMNRAPGDRVPIDPECVAAVAAAARLLESLGHRVERSHPAALDRADEMTLQFLAIWATRAATALAALSQRTGKQIGEADVEAATWALAEYGRVRSAVEIASALASMHAYGRSLAEWWAQGFQILLTPTLAQPPTLLGEFDAAPGDPLRGLRRSTTFSVFTAHFNMSGQPAISLPLHAGAGGLPIGVQLVAAYGREDLLIRVASQLEQAQPWSSRRPPVARVA
jgi:amidase